MRVTAPLKMNEDEIKKKMKEAEEFGEEDKKAYELATAKNEAESMIYITKKTETDLKDKLSKEQYDKLEKGRKALEDAMLSNDVQKIKSETENLQKALSEIGASAYQQAGPDMPGQGNSEEKGYEHVKKKKKKSGEEDVVEGEYEKVDEDKK